MRRSSPESHPAPVSELPARPVSRRRLLIAIVAAGAAVALFGGGWVAARAFTSPAQRAAAAAAPLPTTITAAVERGDLERVVTSDAVLAPAHRQSVGLTAQAGSIVTAQVAAVGQTVSSGSVTFEANGRPVIAVSGAFPFYRDLEVGDEGSDVRQLQTALVDAGLAVTADGTFGSSTASAVRALYHRIGYSTPTVVLESSTSSSKSDSASTSTDSADGAAQANKTQGPPEQAESAGERPDDLVVPAAEFLVARTLPARVTKEPAVGSTLGSDAAVDLADGSLQASASIAASSAAGLRSGMAVQLSGPEGQIADGSVSSVTPSEQAGENTTVVFGNTQIPEAWAGQSVLATVSVEVAAKNSLIVPSSALVSQGGTSGYVVRVRANGMQDRIRVREVASLDGRSAIVGRAGETLRAGDRVRVK